MDKENLKLTSTEIGSLWGEYVNGTAVDMVNRYMLSIIEDEKIKALFQEAIQIFDNQKKQLRTFIEKEGFPVPIAFDERDINKGAKRLFTDIFCLQYLHTMTLHGLLGHTGALSSSIRKDLREFFGSCGDDGKKIYNKTLELLLEKGSFQRPPYFYPDKEPKFISDLKFMDGYIGYKRPLAATELVNLSFNIKKKIMERTLTIAFSQVAQSKRVREFLISTYKSTDKQVKYFVKIVEDDNLPTPMSWETEVTNSQDPPFSDRLIMSHMGFLFQTSQSYHGAGLSTSMRKDLITNYEKIILQSLLTMREWFKIMVDNKWLEQPPLAPDREDIARSRQ